MPKLIKKADGSISFDLDDRIPEESKKKDSIKEMKELKSKSKGKGFDTLTIKDKDKLLKLLLEMHDLI